MQDYSIYQAKGKEHCFFRFKVLPTEISKTDTNKATFDGFVILENSGAVKSGFCSCKGGLVGTYIHTCSFLCFRKMQ